MLFKKLILFIRDCYYKVIILTKFIESDFDSRSLILKIEKIINIQVLVFLYFFKEKHYIHKLQTALWQCLLLKQSFQISQDGDECCLNHQNEI